METKDGASVLPKVNEQVSSVTNTTETLPLVASTRGDEYIKNITIKRSQDSVWETSGGIKHSRVQASKTWHIEDTIECPTKTGDATDNRCIQEAISSTKVSNKFTCGKCGASFTSKVNSDRHRNKHLGLKSFMCDVCGLSFYIGVDLQMHKRIAHTSSSDWPECSECHKRFPTITKLKQHRKHVHLYKEYTITCKHCNKAFTCEANLKMHMTVHADSNVDGKFTCEICSKTYKSKLRLREHSRKHTKTYKCEECDTVCSNASSLSRHRKTHSSTKPHQCHICGHGFTQKSHFWLHMEKHHDLTSTQLIRMFPEKHLSKNYHHQLAVDTSVQQSSSAE